MYFFKKMLRSDDEISSARFINVTGSIVGFILLSIDTFMAGTLSVSAFAIYLSYCGGVYAASKTLSVIDKNNTLDNK